MWSSLFHKNFPNITFWLCFSTANEWPDKQLEIFVQATVHKNVDKGVHKHKNMGEVRQSNSGDVHLVPFWISQGYKGHLR